MALSLNDKSEIAELAARYNLTIDSGDADGWAATFTEDGIFEAPHARPQGREELRQYVLKRDPARRSWRHWINNLIIEGDGDHATLTCYLNLINTAAGPDDHRIAGIGVYRDTLERRQGAWKFTHRHLHFETAP